MESLHGLDKGVDPAGVSDPRIGNRIVALLADAGRAVLDTMLPAQCLSCGTVVDRTAALCGVCWPKIRFIDQPMCAKCGMPFEFAAGDEDICARCLTKPPLFGRARSAFVYDDASRGLVLAFKHGDRTESAPVFGKWMARAGSDLITNAHALIPVPLHWTRLFHRRYNQSVLLAQSIERLTGVPVVSDVLVRMRRTTSLQGLGYKQRQVTMKGVIGVRSGCEKRVTHRRFVIIDDVLTTGATMNACIAALRHHGAEAVDVLTLARVVRPELADL